MATQLEQFLYEVNDAFARGDIDFFFCDACMLSGFKKPKIRAVKSFVIALNGQNGA